MKCDYRYEYTTQSGDYAADEERGLANEADITEVPSTWRGVKQARALDSCKIERVLDHIAANSNSPASDELKFMLTVYAGLRASEVAGLTLADLLDEGRIKKTLTIGSHIAKGGRSRTIPIHPRLRESIIRFRKAHPKAEWISFSNRRGRAKRQNAGAVTRWFSRIYAEAGLTGCSSHSGRRTFVTELARAANLHNRTLRDVQILAGHARLETTAAYIEPAEDLVDLVASIGTERVSSARSASKMGENA